MTHLTEPELVDLLDGVLASSRQAHLDACESCRSRAARLREALAETADAEIPEPSPLFWEHFSARVHEGVREAEMGQPSRWFSWAPAGALKWAMPGAFLAILVVAGVWSGMWRGSAPVPATVASLGTDATVADVGSDGDQEAFDLETPGADEAWALVRTVADDVSWDDAAAERFGVRSGSVEHAMARLTGDERSELLRLLAAETKQPGA